MTAVIDACLAVEYLLRTQLGERSPRSSKPRLSLRRSSALGGFSLPGHVGLGGRHRPGKRSETVY